MWTRLLILPSLYLYQKIFTVLWRIYKITSKILKITTQSHMYRNSVPHQGWKHERSFVGLGKGRQLCSNDFCSPESMQGGGPQAQEQQRASTSCWRHTKASRPARSGCPSKETPSAVLSSSLSSTMFGEKIINLPEVKTDLRPTQLSLLSSQTRVCQNFTNRKWMRNNRFSSTG